MAHHHSPKNMPIFITYVWKTENCDRSQFCVSQTRKSQFLAQFLYNLLNEERRFKLPICNREAIYGFWTPQLIAVKDYNICGVEDFYTCKSPFGRSHTENVSKSVYCAFGKLKIVTGHNFKKKITRPYLCNELRYRSDIWSVV